MSYKLSDQAILLAALVVNIDEEVAAAHPSMQEVTRVRCVAHNDAIDLMTGALGDWEVPQLDADGNPILPAWGPEQFAVPLDSICIELRSTQSPSTLPDAELLRNRISVIKQLDANHPVAKNWRILNARCGSPDWPEFA